jgi:hypothetical protein
MAQPTTGAMTLQPMSDFNSEPKTQSEAIRLLFREWRQFRTEEWPDHAEEGRRTNGRVTRIELILKVVAAFALGLMVAYGILQPAALLPWL